MAWRSMAQRRAHGEDDVTVTSSGGPAGDVTCQDGRQQTARCCCRRLCQMIDQSSSLSTTEEFSYRNIQLSRLLYVALNDDIPTRYRLQLSKRQSTCYIPNRKL